VDNANPDSNSASDDPVDVIRVELLHPDLMDGSINLARGAKLLRGIQVLVQSAAWAAVQPGQILEGSKPSLTNKYLKAIKLAPADSDTYAVQIMSPLSDEFDSPDDDKPYSRLAVQTLAEALRSLADFSAAPKWDDDAMLELLKNGVSANLCAGVGGVLQTLGKTKVLKKTSLDGNMRAVRFAFDWSDTLSPTQGVPSSVTLDPEMFDTIKQLESTLKSFVKENYEFEGYVTQFAIMPGARAGKIIIERVADDRPGRFMIEVSQVEYDQAIDALRNKTLVTGQGTLVRNGGQFSVVDLKEFDVAELQNS
jgi:hypothetical protein